MPGPRPETRARLRAIGIVFRRELRDVLRDRRTLFTMLVLPILLYPTLMLGFARLSIGMQEKIKEEGYPCVLREAGRLVLRDGGPAHEARSEIAKLLVGDERFQLTDLSDPEEKVRRGEIALVLDIPSDAEERAREADGEVVLKPFWRSADDRSASAYRALREHVAAWRVKERNLTVSAANDQASEDERGGQTLGGVLAMAVLFMALTGAFYPALDLGAGEKERGTLETLLLTPVTRAELVLGKYFTILVVACVAALCNLVSLTASFSGFSGMISRGAHQMSFGIDASSFVVILVGLLLLSAFFSAVSLLLSTFARSYKEGQAYLTPIFLVVLPAGMAGMLPGVELSDRTAFIPVANVALMMKALLAGEAQALHIAISLLTLGLFAALALRAAAWAFNREEVLFRGDDAPLLGRRNPGEGPRLRLNPGDATLAFLAGLAVFWYAMQPAMAEGADLGRATAIRTHLLTMGGLALVPFLLVAWRRLNPVRVLGLGAPRPALPAWGVGIATGVMGVWLSLILGTLQTHLLGEPSTEAASDLGRLVRGGSLWTSILLFACLPGLAEEVLCRGAILRGLRGLGRPLAVLTSAVLFAALHMDLHRFFPQAALGLLLGLLAWQTRSVWPAVLAHALHNASLLLLDHTYAQDPGALSPNPWWSLGALPFAGLLVALLRVDRAEAGGALEAR